MELTNSSLLKDAITSYKEELVVIANERFGYMGEYMMHCKEGESAGMAMREMRKEKLRQLIRASGSCIENLETYIKAGTALVKWIDGVAVRAGANLPQLQPSLPIAVQTVLSGVGRGAHAIAQDEVEFTLISIWADFYDIIGTLTIPT